MDGTASSRIGRVEPGTYFVRLYDPTDISKQIALSPDFTIKAKADKPTAAQGDAASGNATAVPATGASATSTTGGSNAQESPIFQIANSSVADSASKSGSIKAAGSGGKCLHAVESGQPLTLVSLYCSL